MDRLDRRLRRHMLGKHSSWTGSAARVVRLAAPLIAVAGMLLTLTAGVSAQEAQWIWSPVHAKEEVPRGACHFRRTFVLRAPVKGQISIAADDSYDVYVNGRRVGRGEFEKDVKQHDITRFLTRGRNTVAIRVVNLRGETAAVAARVMIRQSQGGWKSYSTDKRWKTALRPLPLWHTSLYNDRLWEPAQQFGPLGETPPWDRAEGVAAEERHRSKRFKISDEFEVRRVAHGDDTGSLIAMTFNEFGHVIASREGGPLVLMFDSINDGRFDQVRVYCDKVKNCQGILALNGEVFVTADGPQGNGLYRLTDTNRDGNLDEAKQLIRFNGKMGEHGAHGLTLGSDGLLYVVVGNHSQATAPYAETSPHANYYEGDLVPRYEDPGGHANGVKAPGGVILRTDIEGQAVEVVAGGLRNAYDLAFNREGDLFVHDSDMESDTGTTWYRPTQLFHITAGAEYGWRSGWAKWPDYYVDSLPAIADTGRGSPTGAVVYDHFAFPERYHNALFLADWSRGRIIVARMKPNSGTYTASTEVFLQGQPLNVTDLEVGPDGAIYFSTGGRGTSGGLYRVAWRGKVPEAVSNLGKGISEVIRQPQLHSAWARQQIAGAKQRLGERWGNQLRGVALSTANPPEYRTRAMDLLQLFGPTPSIDLLTSLAKAKNEAVRGKAVELMGVLGDPQARDVMVAMLEDSDRTVRRRACEALLRAGLDPPLEKLIPLLKSDARAEAFAARRLLERIPLEQWKDVILASRNHRLLIQGGLALMIADPTADHGQAVIDRVEELMGGFVTDRDFVDMLRLVQVALHRAAIPADAATQLRDLLIEEFPSGDHIMNRELVRLLVYLQADSIMDRYFQYLDSDVPDTEKLHLAFHLRFLRGQWTSEQRLQLLKFFETAQGFPGGNSFAMYIKNVTRDFAKSLTEEEARMILADGVRWPNAALASLYKLPARLDDDLHERIVRLDSQVALQEGESFERLKVGVVAVLARSGDERSLSYLREIWNRDPERRQAVAMGMAQKPDGENWDYLVRSLTVLEGGPAREVLKKLALVDQRPDAAEPVRQVILRGLLLGEDGSEEAIALLEHWTGEQKSQSDEPWQQALAAWQDWFAKTYPNHSPAELPKAKAGSKWDQQQLLEYLTGEDAKEASATRGELVFTKAQCVKCHRFGERGDRIGPDLTSIHRRFTQKEVLESVLFPSHIISSQYASKTVLTNDGRSFTGLVARGSVGELVVLQSDGRKITIEEDKVEELVPSKVSSMPTGLLDKLSLQEIADLFAFMRAVPGESVSRQPATPTP